jgi:hypothetical protein
VVAENIFGARMKDLQAMWMKKKKKNKNKNYFYDFLLFLKFLII